ncbi:hypothetical protein BaRGS_00027326 [Batillaria attramentaria]|uniref:Uncharacterized protein n=1 Tax=Batillaria attramentaria TaxID=370345 RepID=A0ABD0K1T6_9CAEN
MYVPHAKANRKLKVPCEHCAEFTVWLERRHVRYLSQRWEDIARRLGTQYFPLTVFLECDRFLQTVPDLLMLVTVDNHWSSAAHGQGVAANFAPRVEHRFAPAMEGSVLPQNGGPLGGVFGSAFVENPGHLQPRLVFMAPPAPVIPTADKTATVWVRNRPISATHSTMPDVKPAERAVMRAAGAGELQREVVHGMPAVQLGQEKLLGRPILGRPVGMEPTPSSFVGGDHFAAPSAGYHQGTFVAGNLAHEHLLAAPLAMGNSSLHLLAAPPAMGNSGFYGNVPTLDNTQQGAQGGRAFMTALGGDDSGMYFGAADQLAHVNGTHYRGTQGGGVCHGTPVHDAQVGVPLPVGGAPASVFLPGGGQSGASLSQIAFAALMGGSHPGMAGPGAHSSSQSHGAYLGSSVSGTSVGVAAPGSYLNPVAEVFFPRMQVVDTYPGAMLDSAFVSAHDRHGPSGGAGSHAPIVGHSQAISGRTEAVIIGAQPTSVFSRSDLERLFHENKAAERRMYPQVTILEMPVGAFQAAPSGDGMPGAFLHDFLGSGPRDRTSVHPLGGTDAARGIEHSLRTAQHKMLHGDNNSRSCPPVSHSRQHVNAHPSMAFPPHAVAPPYTLQTSLQHQQESAVGQTQSQSFKSSSHGSGIVSNSHSLTSSNKENVLPSAGGEGSTPQADLDYMYVDLCLTNHETEGQF